MPVSRSREIDGTIVLPMRYLGDVHYYAAVAAYSHAVIDASVPFDKRQKLTHRCTIADTHGLLNLTIPIEKPVSMSRAQWSDIVISDHGAWWNVHLTALKSAYGRTPFFEFYVDDFLEFYTADCAGKKLADYNAALDATLRRLLGIDTQVDYVLKDFDKNSISGRVDDFRTRGIDFTEVKEYYQIRSDKYGFQPSISVVDLLFNLGPEAIMVLRSMVTKQ